ncbi:MAG: LacI family DNA-binding transcriptional regulator [Spirochaetes bacterium]|uniref:LacI family DNA-binding transcriptional regulator n=1 Tax=Candidatus Ornithospirochaeta stercoripullorum TaxID=2840899 RepID=A0A9D9E2G6_9SPIO|nr:LacI family DNA-binding transcriptional regulator [Candidatus Ornithospirochaeta stercoripullorum]
MITLKEIAQRAGVSLGTVDRVLHNRGRVSKENIERVMQIAHENGYVPNQLARRLKQGQRLRFGIVIPDISTEYGYWAQIADGIEEARKEIAPMEADVVYSFFDRHEEGSFASAVSSLFSSHIDAWVIAPIADNSMQSVIASHADVPFAFIDSSLPGLNPGWNFAQDPVRAGKTAARLMLLSDPGIRRVITLQGDEGAFNGEMRASAFADEFRQKRCDADIINVYADDPLDIAEAIKEAAKEAALFGLFVVNDQAAIVCSTLEEPLLEKARIIGFDLSDENRKCLLSGEIFAIIGQRPRAQGHDAVIAMYNYFTLPSSTEEGNLSAPVDIYIKENIPESSHWL